MEEEGRTRMERGRSGRGVNKERKNEEGVEKNEMRKRLEEEGIGCVEWKGKRRNGRKERGEKVEKERLEEEEDVKQKGVNRRRRKEIRVSRRDEEVKKTEGGETKKNGTNSIQGQLEKE